MTIHKEKTNKGDKLSKKQEMKQVEENVIRAGEVIKKSLGVIIDVDFVSKLELLIKSFSGGACNISHDLLTFRLWVRDFLPEEDTRKFRNLYAILEHEDDGPDDVTHDLDEEIDYMGAIEGDVSIYLGMDDILLKTKEFNMADQMINVLSSGEEHSLAFEDGDVFCLISQFTCRGCSAFHVRMWVVRNSKAEQNQPLINHLKSIAMDSNISA